MEFFAKSRVFIFDKFSLDPYGWRLPAVFAEVKSDTNSYLAEADIFWAEPITEKLGGDRPSYYGHFAVIFNTIGVNDKITRLFAEGFSHKADVTPTLHAKAVEDIRHALA